MSQSSSNVKPTGKPAEAVLSLGSNRGTREWFVLAAANRLARSAGLTVTGLSSLYETEPEGEGFSGPFVNAVCTVLTSLDPFGLLELCNTVEKEFGRDREKAGRDRTVDVDIILYGGIRLNEPDLVIPHPRFEGRAFVLVPLVELAPLTVVPPGRDTIRDILSRLDRKGKVRRISSRSIIF